MDKSLDKAYSHKVSLIFSFSETEKEVNEKLEEMAKNYGKKAEELNKNENVMKYLKQGILNEKAVDFLVKNAKMK